MSWLNPWAWIGLAWLALPILIHLLGRGDAKRQPFPSLRFLPASRSLPMRRRRVRDPLLLVVRIGILSAAVAALARPLFVSPPHVDDSRRLARAIIVDTSASMRRLTPNGESALNAAKREAQRLATESQRNVVIETAFPARAFAGAFAWIARQSGRADVVVVSDFQTGVIEARDVANVPAGVGIRLARIDVRGRSDEPRAQSSPTTSSVHASIAVLTGAAERDAAAAAQRAAASLHVEAPFDSSHAISVVYPSYEQRAELLRRATLPRAPWMMDVVARIRADSLLIRAASMASPRAVGNAAAGIDSAAAVAVARTSSGKPVIVAAAALIAGRDQLLLLPLVDAGSLTSAALLTSATRGLSLAPPGSELDSSRIDEATLTSWQREPGVRGTSSVDARGAGMRSDGRWLWVVALLLIALETVMRRARREPVVTEEQHERAA